MNDREGEREQPEKPLTAQDARDLIADGTLRVDDVARALEKGWHPARGRSPFALFQEEMRLEESKVRCDLLQRLGCLTMVLCLVAFGALMVWLCLQLCQGSLSGAVLERIRGMSPYGRVIFAAAVWLAASGCYFVRREVRSGRGCNHFVLVWQVIFCGCVIAAARGEFGPLHLAWLYPAAATMGFLSDYWPLRVVRPVGVVFGLLCCVGLDRRRAWENRCIVGICQNQDLLHTQGEAAYEKWAVALREAIGEEFRGRFFGWPLKH